MAVDLILSIRRDFPRPLREALEAFEGVGSGMVCDAQMRVGALHHAIRPVTSRCRFVGPALPVYAGPKDNLASYAALKVAKPGDVVVIANGGFEGCAALGDIFVGMARNAGVVACVTDGMARDLPGIEEVGIPVFARGITPNSPFKNGPGTVGMPISVGGVPVDAGDIVFGDEDGVVVVPLSSVGRMLPVLERVKTKEAEMSALVGEGRTVPGWLEDVLAGPNVEWL